MLIKTIEDYSCSNQYAANVLFLWIYFFCFGLSVVISDNPWLLYFVNLVLQTLINLHSDAYFIASCCFAVKKHRPSFFFLNSLSVPFILSLIKMTQIHLKSICCDPMIARNIELPIPGNHWARTVKQALYPSQPHIFPQPCRQKECQEVKLIFLQIYNSHFKNAKTKQNQINEMSESKLVEKNRFLHKILDSMEFSTYSKILKPQN